MRTLLLLLCGCVHALPPTMTPDDVVYATTPDGWSLPVRHFPGPGRPVLLVHGMAANHYNFDFRPEVSLAAYLQDLGWDVWVPELRGDPGAVPPAGADPRDVSFDDLALDMPRIVDRVLAVTGQTQLDWVGHSMGGMLLYTALSTMPEKIGAGVAISSPATFERGLPSYDAAWRARFLVKGDGVLPTRGLARFFVGLGLGRALEGRLADEGSMSTPMLRGLAHDVLWPVPNATARQALTWIDRGALVREDGSPWVSPGATVPLLVMAGVGDRVVNAADVAAACEVFPDCAWVELSERAGFSHDYGHVDPVVGRTAALEIYPRVAMFLTEHAPSAEAPVATSDRAASDRAASERAASDRAALGPSAVRP